MRRPLLVIALIFAGAVAVSFQIYIVTGLFVGWAAVDIADELADWWEAR